MTDESPSNTIQAPEEHVLLEDSASLDGHSSQSMPEASASTTAAPLLSNTATSHVPESFGVEPATHNLDVNETLNDIPTSVPLLADVREGTSEATQENNGEAPLAHPSASESPLTRVGNDNGSTPVMPKTIQPDAVEERVLEEKDPLGVVEGDVTERTQTHDNMKVVEDEDEDTISKDLKSPGFHKNSPSMHQRDDSTDVGLMRGSPQPWDLVDPPDTNGRGEFYSTGGPKAYGSAPNKPCVANPSSPSIIYLT
jgi:hypothetical protein